MLPKRLVDKPPFPMQFEVANSMKVMSSLQLIRSIPRGSAAEAGILDPNPD